MYDILDIVNSIIEAEDGDYVYIYESHMGGTYSTNEELEWEELDCCTCGDSDILVEHGNKGDLLKKYWDKFYTIFQSGRELINELDSEKSFDEVLEEWGVQKDSLTCTDIGEKCYDLNVLLKYGLQGLRGLIEDETVPYNCKTCIMNELYNFMS